MYGIPLACVQILHLEIDYHSLKKQSVRAEVADVAHMEEQLSNIAANMQVRKRGESLQQVRTSVHTHIVQ